ncbi:MAG: cytochrome c maturation protein CcmE [Bauldia sp.]|nr:cytochrome c maturation protein CcmE [Bauldia sp.]
MGRKQRRLIIIALAGTVLVAAVALILVAMSGSITFFSSPSEVLANPPAQDQRIRLGGLVAVNTVERHDDGVIVFGVTDMAATVQVQYQGIVPDLFREGQGVVTEGTLGPNGVFMADTVLAKHDEAYMPAEVVNALREQGEWYGDVPANMDTTNAPAPTPAVTPATPAP